MKCNLTAGTPAPKHWCDLGAKRPAAEAAPKAGAVAGGPLTKHDEVIQLKKAPEAPLGPPVLLQLLADLLRR